MACQKSSISQRFLNILARFHIHSAPSPTMTTTVFDPVHPNSLSCAHTRLNTASALPRQLTRNFLTTERRPGQVSTRSLGSRTIPVFTSRKWPSSTGGKGGSGWPSALVRRRFVRTCIPSAHPSNPVNTTAGAASSADTSLGCHCDTGSSVHYVVPLLLLIAAILATPPSR